MAALFEQRVLNVFRKVFPRVGKLSDQELKATVRRGSIEEWDSLGHMTLLAALGDEFAVRITPGQALKLKCVDDVTRILDDSAAPVDERRPWSKTTPP
jgi:acyl carrier protein